MPLLEIRDLKLEYRTRRGISRALNSVSLTLEEGEVLGIAGESGSGKSTLGSVIIGLIPENSLVTSGEVLFKGENLLKDAVIVNPGRKWKKKQRKALSRIHRRMRVIRGKEISMVFQDSLTSLNPLLKVGYQISEVLIYHNPESLAERALARYRSSKEDMRKVISILKEKEGLSQELMDFLLSRGLKGLEEQVAEIWNSQTLSQTRKESEILKLADDKPKASEVRIYENVLKGKTRSMLRIPLLSRSVKRALLKEGYKRSAELLATVGISNPQRVVNMYPHELSGGMRQRVLIAIAIANSPRIVILDEPTSALDVTVQAQVLELVKSIKGKGSSFIFISHDLSVLAEVSDRIAIMYAGKVVEVGPTEAVLNSPKHPYTKSLIMAVPDLEGREISAIPGDVPDPRNLPPGCPFHPRCSKAISICSSSEPRSVNVGDRHVVSCHLYDEAVLKETRRGERK